MKKFSDFILPFVATVYPGWQSIDMRDRESVKDRILRPDGILSEELAPGVAAGFHGDVGAVGGAHADDAGRDFLGDGE